MKNKKSWQIALVVVLCVAMILPFLPGLKADAAEPNFSYENVDGGNGSFAGKYLSVIGDSISTYAGVSNGTGYNATIGGNAVYYEENNPYGVQREDTWWQQAIDALGMKLCVNNSWSGSCVFSDGGSSNPYKAAWKPDRSKQLHNASGDKPDYIAVFMGTNDLKQATSFEGFSSNKDTMISQASGTATSGVKQFSLYIRMVNNMMTAYPNAQIYLFTLLPNDAQNQQRRTAMETFNQSIRDLVTYYQGQGKKAYLVDLYNDTSITNDFNVVDVFLANTLHPNASGMDAITNCFLSSLVKNSGDAKNPGNWRDIEYDLTDVYVQGGQINTLRVSGSEKCPIAVDLMPTRPEYDLDVKVELLRTDGTWEDITSTSYSGSGQVYIEGVTHSYSKARITAKAVYKSKDLRWEMVGNEWVSCTDDGTDYHISGSLTNDPVASKAGSVSAGKFMNAEYSISDSILLRNEEPWVMELKVKGTLQGGQMFLSGSATASEGNNEFIYSVVSDTARRLHIGYRMRHTGSGYWNFGVDVPNSITLNDSTSHVYRLVNKIASDGSNMVYLFIDGEEIGTMDNYHIGDKSQAIKDDWLSGRDLEFNFFGADNFYLKNCGFEYFQVWEGGSFDTSRLCQLIEEYDLELSDTMTGVNGFDAYQTAITNGRDYLEELKANDNGQDKIDALVDAILTARDALTVSTTETKIYDIERVSKDFVPIGRPTGLKIITTPDVTKIQVGNTAQKLLTSSSKIQTIDIQGVPTQVKVWFVTWARSATAQKVVEYHVHAYTTDMTSSAASELVYIPYGADCLMDLRVTVAPDKTDYVAGESFDKTGMQVVAYYGDGSQKDVTASIEVDKTTLSASDDHVMISYNDAVYGKLSVRLPIKVLTDVSGLDQVADGTLITLRGRYVGVASEGLNSDEEVLIRDVVTNDVIAIRNVPGNFPNYNYQYAYTVNIIGTVYTDGSEHTPTKRYLDYDYRNGDVDDTIVSMATYMPYEIEDVIEISSWDQMQALFDADLIQPYSYIKFSGDVWFHNYYSDTEGMVNYRLHMNGSAAKAGDIKCDGRAVCLREDMMVKNLGEDWVEAFALADGMTTDGYPGSAWTGELIALYTGANSTYFQLTILDLDWIVPASA